MSACPPKRVSKLKPYYQDNSVAIYHGDCRDIIPQLGRFDLMVTDPPYGIGEAAGKNKSRGKLAKAKDYGNDDWDNCAPDWLNELIPFAQRSIIFGGNYFRLPPSRGWLVWDKENGASDFADAELAWTNLKTAVRLKCYRWSGMLQGDMKNKEVRFHPTQKPVPVMEWAVLLAHRLNPVKFIIDPFMGSGTTLVAAKNLGIHCTGIEREKKYIDVAIKRLAQEVFPL